MIRLTVLYNLKPEVNEQTFLDWRLTEHQESNSSMEGVSHTDFTLNDEAWPQNDSPRYRFMTTAVWPDIETFNKVFYEPNFQAKLKKGVEEKLADYTFLIGEILSESKID